MNLYLNYFETEQNVDGDNPPIGIILSKYKDDVTVEYAIRGITNKIFVSKYQLYLPDKKILKKKLKELLDKISHRTDVSTFARHTWPDNVKGRVLMFIVRETLSKSIRSTLSHSFKNLIRILQDGRAMRNS